MASARQYQRGSPPIPDDQVGAWLDDALPRLFGYFVVRVGGRSDVAEDLTQDTVLAAVRSSNVPDGVDPMAWLFGIARHKLVDHYRREERDRRQFGRFGEVESIDIGPSSPLARLDFDSITTRADIIATLDHLPPRQRSALVLRYFDDLDVASVASLLDLSLHATESLLARGRASFRRTYLEISGEPA